MLNGQRGPLYRGKASDPGKTADNRPFLEAVSWLARTGSPWRDLPAEFGNWNSVFQRYRRWIKGGVFTKSFKPQYRSRLRIHHDRYHHRQGSPPRTGRKRGTQNQAIGKSKGGMTTKILAMVDALGNLIDFKLMPGQRNDICGVAPLIEGKEFAALLADKAFDADWLLLELEERGSVAVIPPRRNRKEQRAYDKEAYKKRHLVENFFCDLKEYKKIAMRSEKTDESFAANIYSHPPKVSDKARR